jgi:hypothetical protein
MFLAWYFDGSLPEGYPCFSALLEIVAVLPVGSASVERSFSSRGVLNKRVEAWVLRDDVNTSSAGSQHVRDFRVRVTTKRNEIGMGWGRRLARVSVGGSPPLYRRATFKTPLFYAEADQDPPSVGRCQCVS